MTVTAPSIISPSSTGVGLVSRLVNFLLSVRPIAQLAKARARKLMIDRAEAIGVPWRRQAHELQSRDWSRELGRVQNPNLVYPSYYTVSFHAYDEGNLGWEPASEVEVAAYAVHSTIFGEMTLEGDARLRSSFHAVLQAQLPTPPRDIVDLGCSVGMSTFALQRTFPAARLTGVDLSPYFLAVADYNTDHSPMNLSPQGSHGQPRWVHAAAEATGLPSASYDLVSACLLFHELPQAAAIAILSEARRLLRPGGHVAIMDMNPQSAIYAQMPPYILTLLKSTEPYLDQYFSLDLAGAIAAAGFKPATITETTRRHRAVLAQVPQVGE